jgi:hypothetical protein
MYSEIGIDMLDKLESNTDNNFMSSLTSQNKNTNKDSLFISRLPSIPSGDELILNEPNNNAILNQKEYDFELMNSESCYANCSLEELQKMYVTSNSPLMSNQNSDYDTDSEISHIRSHAKPSTHSYKKLTFSDVEKSLEKYYSSKESIIMNIDMLTSFIHGQKIIFMYAKNISYFKWGLVLAISFSLSTFIAIFMPFIDTHNKISIISVPSGFVSILLLLQAFCKFESSGCVFHLKSIQHDSLENKIGFYSSLQIDKEKLNEILEMVESKCAEINNNHINIPSYVIDMFPLIYHTNIFAFLKKIELYKKNLIIKFKNIKNEINHILNKWTHHDNIDNINNIDESKLSSRILKEKKRLAYLIELKDKTKKELLDYNSIFVQLNDLFIKEIKYAHANKYWYIFSRIFNKPDYQIDKLNPVLRDYILLISPS